MLQAFYRFIGSSPVRWHTSFAVVFVAVLALELFGMHLLATTEYRLSDIYMQRHASEYRVDPDIVVVDIDDHSMTEMQEIAGLWSWPRSVHADLLQGLAEFAPRAVVFDIAFSEHDFNRRKGDVLLSNTVKAMPNVYLSAVQLPPSAAVSGTRISEVSSAFGIAGIGRKDTFATLQLPHAVEPAAWRLGLTNAVKDDDGVLRHYRLYSEEQAWRLPSLPARVAQGLGVVLPQGGDFVMRWPDKGHQHSSYSELYKLLTEKRLTLNVADVRALDALFRDKIIVIGSSATGSFDHHHTPLKAGYPGVDILALALDNLKSGQHVRVAPVYWAMLLGLALIAAVAFAFTKRANPLLVGAALLAATCVTLFAADWALGRNQLFRIATPLIFAWAWYLAAAISGYLRERRSREQAVSLFGRFLDPVVVRKMVEQGETVESLSGRTCNITVLFSDIRGFTTLSETRTPHEVVTLLNRYFERQVEVVWRHGGTLDKFIGDCIMAFWGAPLDDPEHASRAVAAALEMQSNLLEFKKELAAEDSSVSDFDVGIGVHSGPAVVGFIGAQRKLDYTAIGDTVNLASRVEGLTKGIARVLVTQETMLACQASNKFTFTSHGSFPVKGRAAEVELYEPAG